MDRPFVNWVIGPYVFNICVLPSIESDLEQKLQCHKQPDSGVPPTDDLLLLPPRVQIDTTA